MSKGRNARPALSLSGHIPVCRSTARFLQTSLRHQHVQVRNEVKQAPKYLLNDNDNDSSAMSGLCPKHLDCGENLPATGGGSFIVQDSFDLRPGSVNGPISGSVLGNDQIFCGNIHSTFYLVTSMKDATGWM